MDYSTFICFLRSCNQQREKSKNKKQRNNQKIVYEIKYNKKKEKNVTLWWSYKGGLLEWRIEPAVAFICCFVSLSKSKSIRKHC